MSEANKDIMSMALRFLHKQSDEALIERERDMNDCDPCFAVRRPPLHPGERALLIESLEEQIWVNVRDELDGGVELLKEMLSKSIEQAPSPTPPKPVVICPCCGSSNVWIAARVNPNNGERDEESMDPAGCWDNPDGQCDDLSQVGQLLAGCGECDECKGGNWCRELPHPEDGGQ